MDIQYFDMVKYLDLTEVRLRYIKATFQSSKSEMFSFCSILCKKTIIKVNNNLPLNLKGMLGGSCDYIASLVKIFKKIYISVFIHLHSGL